MRSPDVFAHPQAGREWRIDGELVVRQIATDSYVVTHLPFYAANVLVVRMPDGTVVICSSPFETEATRAMVAWIRRTLRPGSIVAINTHFHFDGTGGNEAYRELGVETYASELTQRLLREKGPLVQRESAASFADPVLRRRVAVMKIVAATHTFAEREGLKLTFGGEPVHVVFPGAAHAPDNLLVHFPARRLLFGGCMVRSSPEIGFIGHADLQHWPAAVEVARALGPRLVVPGHGPVGGPELLNLTDTIVRSASPPPP